MQPLLLLLGDTKNRGDTQNLGGYPEPGGHPEPGVYPEFGGHPGRGGLVMERDQDRAKQHYTGAALRMAGPGAVVTLKNKRTIMEPIDEQE